MATLETQQLDEIIASSRRKMLTLGGAALATMAFSSMASAQTVTLVDADYLNFALNLEYLEANFYTLAVSGQTIDQMGIALTGIVGSGTTTGAGGAVVTKPGGATACKVPFTNTLVQAYATEIAREERNHVTFLRSALGSAAVAQPAIDLYNSFNYLVSLLPLGVTTFDPFANDMNFLIGSYIFEDVGVTAYTGAAPSLTVPTNLDNAAGIQGVEAYHAGVVRTTIVALDQSAATLPTGSTFPAGTYRTAATAISNLRSTVDGTATTASRTNGDDIGLEGQQVTLNGTSSLTATSLVNATTTGSINTAAAGANTTGSLVFARTAAQVLKIVYAGGTSTSNKGFFPTGLNGKVF